MKIKIIPDTLLIVIFEERDFCLVFIGDKVLISYVINWTKNEILFYRRKSIFEKIKKRRIVFYIRELNVCPIY